MKIFPPPGKAVEAHLHEQQDNKRPSTFFTDAGAFPMQLPNLVPLLSRNTVQSKDTDSCIFEVTVQA